MEVDGAGAPPTPLLCKTMTKADLDAFLKDAFGVASNPFHSPAGRCKSHAQSVSQHTC